MKNINMKLDHFLSYIEAVSKDFNYAVKGWVKYLIENCLQFFHILREIITKDS